MPSRRASSRRRPPNALLLWSPSTTPSRFAPCAALDAGLAVGPTFGVGSFDDTPGIQHFSPPLSSVRQPILEVAQTLVPMLFKLIDGQRPNPDKVVLEPRLIGRASSLRTTTKEQQS